jgi:hypothetical protein
MMWHCGTHELGRKIGKLLEQCWSSLVARGSQEEDGGAVAVRCGRRAATEEGPWPPSCRARRRCADAARTDAVADAARGEP